MCCHNNSVRLLFILSILLPCCLQGDDHYRVQFDDRLHAVEVEACFDGPVPGRLYRNKHAAKFTEWIRSGSRDIGRYSHGSKLTLPDLPDDACVSWRVNLKQATEQKDYRLALSLDDSIITDGNLWFWRDGERRPILVEVVLPHGVSISTPWKEQETHAGNRGENTVFRPDPTPASWSSRIAVGDFRIQRIPVAGTELRLATIGGLNARQHETISAWIKETADAVASVYSRFPRQAPQILVIPIGQRGQAVPWAHVLRGGGAAAEFFVDETRSLNSFREDWTASHELSHMLLPYVTRDDRWLSEGLASYYQNVLRARDGRLSEQQAWQRLHRGFERGRAGTGGGSLARATRSGWGSTMRVYWSGAAIMLKADSELRMLTGGRQSLDSALGVLQECCFENERTWQARELLSELDRITGTSIFTDLYREHVMDDEFPDVEYTFEQLGLVPRSNSIRFDPDAPWGRIRYYIMKG
jgi:predicted metalloprotease with PDZ domain